MAGIEPALSAWKAGVIPLYDIRATCLRLHNYLLKMVEGEGFEPSKAEPSDLQSDPFGHSGTPPEKWCRHQESNSGPTDYKSVALPTELCRLIISETDIR